MNRPPAPSYTQLLRQNPDYRRVWFGELVSYFGDWFKMIALYAIVQQLTDSTLAVAGVVVGATLPSFLVIPIAGPIVDRFDRRVVMIVTDVARAVLALGLIGAYWLASLPLLFLVLFVMVGFSGVFIPARTAVVPQVTREHELPVAMALSGGTWSVMLAFGAAIGGVVTSFIGVEGALLLDGVTFLASAAILWGLPPLPAREEGSDDDEPGLKAGLRYLARKPYLAVTLMNKPMLGLAGAALAMLPVYGNGVFPLGGPFFIGLLYSMRGFGALVGSMGVRRVLGDEPETMRRLITPGYGVMVLGLVGTAFAPTMALAALGFFVVAVGQGVVWVFSGTLAQLASDRAFRGRIFSLEFGTMTLVTSASSLAAGGAVDAGWATVRQSVGVAGLALLLPLVLWTLAVPLLKARGAVDDSHLPLPKHPKGEAPGPV